MSPRLLTTGLEPSTFIFEGNINSDIAFVQIESNAILDVDPLTWTVFSAAAIPVNSVANDRLVQVAQATVKGRQAAGGTGNVEDLTADQLIAIVNTGSTSIDAGTY